MLTSVKIKKGKIFEEKTGLLFCLNASMMIDEMIGRSLL